MASPGTSDNPVEHALITVFIQLQDVLQYKMTTTFHFTVENFMKNNCITVFIQIQG
jgi:hypothetical protein